MVSPMLLVLVLLASPCDAATPAREVVNFDFAWRHKLDPPAPPPAPPGPPPPWHPEPGPAKCTVALVKQASSAKCTEGKSFGCYDGLAAMWTDGGCRGDFHCDDKKITCDSNHHGEAANPGLFNCSCVAPDTAVALPKPPPPPPPVDPNDPTAQPGFDDSAWELIDTPHDMGITGKHDPANNPTQGFLPRTSGWYRKHFKVPAEWKGSSVYVYIEGSFHITNSWFNGKHLAQHNGGYTSFWLRLDTEEIKYGEENVLALYVDATTGTGWWYEGGGLVRHNYLIRTAPLHAKLDSVWSYSNVTAAAVNVADSPSLGSTGDAVLHCEATLENDAATASKGSISVTVLDGDGKSVAAGKSTAESVPADGQIVVSTKLPVPGAELWSVARPYLYTLIVDILDETGATVDSVNVTAGIRTVKFDADEGLKLNDESLKVRGFCDHSNWGAVGNAVPDRINFFRAQMLRSVGGNAWRMAHNPPIPARIDFADRLGVLIMDENRDYGGHKGQGGWTSETVDQEVVDMGNMVQRDRSHPSVFIWSFCNEVGCDNETAAAAFRNISYYYDGTRGVTQNHHGTGGSEKSLDVQGFSHRSGEDFDKFHAQFPKEPMMATECCSCLSQRGEDFDECPVPRTCVGSSCHVDCAHDGKAEASNGTFYNNEISQCTATQVNESDSREFVAGTFVWSGFDYLGEARGWPQSVKPRGVITDIAGFKKETYYWLRSWWLSNIDAKDAGRPPLPVDTTVFIVDTWRMGLQADGTRMNSTRNIHVYSDAPFVSLQLNGKEVVPKTAMPGYMNGNFPVAYEAGNLTAVGHDKDGKVIGSFTRLTPAAGGVKSLKLSIDAPSPLTGTGSALVADGEDTAMVRVTLLDKSGELAVEANDEVVFEVKSGDGKLWGTHSGNPAADMNTNPAHGGTRAAYHGLARAYIRSSSDHATTPDHRRRLRQIDMDGGVRTTIADPAGDGTAAPLAGIEVVVTLKSDPSITDTLTIPLTTDLSQLPLAVAERAAERNSVSAF
jgi:hypothetical protein